MSQLILSDIRRRYVVERRRLPASVEVELRADPRAGAKIILAAIEKRRRGNRAEGQRLRNLLRFESQLWADGVVHVAGIDEAGMSPLAGPVAAAAVVLPAGTRIAGIDDSKKLDAPARDALAIEVKAKAVAWAVGFAEVEEIDRINIYWAGLLAMRRAVEALQVVPQHLLIDGRRLADVTLPQQKIIGGDGRSQSIAAASILAKTARDRVMEDLDLRYPGYGLARHKGYPVKHHRDMIVKLGATAIHRRSFAFVREVLGLPPLPPWPTV